MFCFRPSLSELALGALPRLTESIRRRHEPPTQGPVRPKRTRLDSQALLRELQKALAVAKCISLAAEYGEDDEPDLADALAGLLIVMEGTAALLDQPEVSP